MAAHARTNEGSQAELVRTAAAHAALVGPIGIKCVRPAAALFTVHTYIVSCKY